MAEPLKPQLSTSCSRRASTRRDRILVLVTDGQVGNEDQILQAPGSSGRKATAHLHAGHRSGGERGVSAAPGDLGGGASEMVESEDRLDEVMDQVQRHIGTPVLTGLKLEPAGLKFIPGSVVPGRLPDLFAGMPLLIMGRYRGIAARRHIALQGRDAAGQPWLADGAAANERTVGVAASVWARAGCANWRIATSRTPATGRSWNARSWTCRCVSACCAASRRSWRWIAVGGGQSGRSGAWHRAAGGATGGMGVYDEVRRRECL